MQEKQQEYKYSVVEENKENFLHSKIRKENVTVDFTLNDIEAHRRNLEKFITENDAKTRVHAAEMVNIERNHPFVKKFDDKQLHTLGLYIDAIREIKKVEPTLQEAKKAIEEYEAEKKEIYKQCNFDISSLMEDNTAPVEDNSTEETQEDSGDEAAATA